MRALRALAIALCALAPVLVVAAAGAATAAGAAAAAGEGSAGRSVFVDGGGAVGDVVATFPGTKMPLAARVRRCAGCHGREGGGRREGGTPVPPITWAALTAPRETSPARPGRPGYDRATLARAVVTGIDAAGRTLAAGMPRFQLSATQCDALIDYLRVLGTDDDREPGVTADEIRVGAVLPLSGAQAGLGRAMRAGLETALAAAGPIYGRRLRLIARDAGDDPVQALRRLVAGDQVFALVATMLPADDAASEEADDLPVIGPLMPTPAHPADNRFHLLAPVEDQMRVLVDALAAETPHAMRIALVGPAGTAADAAAEQAARAGATVIRAASADDLVAAAPDAVLALPGSDLRRLLALRAERQAAWLLAGSAETLAPGEATDEWLRLVLPVLPADPRRGAAPGPPPLATAAAAVLVEGLKRMGARVSRTGLLATLETLHDFQTGLLPPVGFGRAQRIGTRASVVIRPDGALGLVVLGDWRTPR